MKKFADYSYSFSSEDATTDAPSYSSAKNNIFGADTAIVVSILFFVIINIMLCSKLLMIMPIIIGVLVLKPDKQTANLLPSDK